MFITDVALLSNQFEGYCDGLNRIEITATGDYTIPAGCFSKGDAKGYNTKQLDCKVDGRLTIGEKAVDYGAGGLNIYTYREAITQAWINYKITHNCAYTVYLNGL